LNFFSKYLGLDDGYFPPEYKGRRGKTVLVGAITENSLPIDLMVRFIEIDGLDATEKSIDICLEAIQKHGIKAVFTDGVTYGGFNIVDPKELSEKCNIPVIVIFRHELYLRKVKEALLKHFPDWKIRFRIISQTYNEALKVSTKCGVLRVTCIGIEYSRCIETISKLQTVFPEPQPLKVADLTASALARLLIYHLSKINNEEMMRTTESEG